MSGNNFNDRNGVLRRIANVLLPPPVWLLCRTLGLLTWVFSSRGKTATRNIALAFPEKDDRWHRRMAFKSILRMFELFAIPLVTPWLSNDELKRRFKITARASATFDKLTAGENAIMLSPHCAMTESIAVVPMLYPGLKFTVVYRPLDLPPAEKYAVWARTRWGLELLSRHRGLLGISHALARGRSPGILFDQNTRTSGALILSMGRICAATDLPGILATRLHKPVYIIHARRTGFLTAIFDVLDMEGRDTVADITAQTTLTFEKVLRSDEDACADWMWAHHRWKSDLSNANHCLNLSYKKNYLASSLKLLGLSEFPRRQPFILRVPEDRKCAEIVAGWMPRLRAARPDVKWIVMSNTDNARLFVEGSNCERLVTCESAHIGKTLKSLRKEWPEFYMTLEPESDVKKEAIECDALNALGINSKHGGKYHRTAFFKADASRFTAEHFDELLTDVFKSCGMEIAPQ